MNGGRFSVEPPDDLTCLGCGHDGYCACEPCSECGALTPWGGHGAVLCLDCQSRVCEGCGHLTCRCLLRFPEARTKERPVR